MAPRSHTRIGNILHSVRSGGNIGDAIWADSPIFQVKCFPEEGLQDLDHRTCDLTNAGLDEHCDAGVTVARGHSTYSIAECVVAYYCHLDRRTETGDTGCTSRTRRQASQEITDGCGWYKSGRAGRRITDTNKGKFREDVYGYQSWCTDEGKKFCNSGI